MCEEAVYLLLLCRLQAQDESRAAPAKPVNDPPHLLLPGAVRMPLLGLGTYKMDSADAVKTALECERAAGARRELRAGWGFGRADGCCFAAAAAACCLQNLT